MISQYSLVGKLLFGISAQGSHIMAQFKKFSSACESGQLIVMKRPGQEEDCSQDDYLRCIHSLRFVQIKDLWRESGDVYDRTDNTSTSAVFTSLCKNLSIVMVWSVSKGLFAHAYLSYPSLSTNGRRCPVVVKTTPTSILELSTISAIFAAKVSLN